MPQFFQTKILMGLISLQKEDNDWNSAHFYSNPIGGSPSEESDRWSLTIENSLVRPLVYNCCFKRIS